MRAAIVVQQVCKSCRTCFKFYCMFYFTCDRSFSSAYKAGSLRTPRLPGTKPTYRPLPHKCETHITSIYRSTPGPAAMWQRHNQKASDLASGTSATGSGIDLGEQARRRRSVSRYFRFTVAGPTMAALASRLRLINSFNCSTNHTLCHFITAAIY